MQSALIWVVMNKGWLGPDVIVHVVIAWDRASSQAGSVKQCYKYVFV